MSAHGKHRKRRRGCHKAHTSPETQRWNSDHLIPPRPDWMSAAIYARLAELRAKL